MLPALGAFLSKFVRDTERVENFLDVRSAEFSDCKSMFLTLVRMIDKAAYTWTRMRHARNEEAGSRLRASYFEYCEQISDASNETFARDKDLTPREQVELKALIERVASFEGRAGPDELGLQDFRDEFQSFADQR